MEATYTVKSIEDKGTRLIIHFRVDFDGRYSNSILIVRSDTTEDELKQRLQQRAEVVKAMLTRTPQDLTGEQIVSQAKAQVSNIDGLRQLIDQKFDLPSNPDAEAV